MIYSRSADYAIRALVFLARAPVGTYTMARVIAEREQIPAYFLAKILQDLARKGILRSSRGPSGGFTLRLPASQISLLEIIEALDGKSLATTAGQLPWMLDSWKALHSRIMDSLGRSTVADVAKAVNQHRGDEKPKRSRRSAARRS
ncbi:MAG: RrF2 family transcriptional regulator [Bryobacteraceae bacterium]